MRAPQASAELPRLAFFRGTHSTLPSFIRRHLDEQVRCLSQWFDVHVVSGSADYARVVDEVEPAACLMESGIYAHGREIRNVRAGDGILKAGFLQADAYCPSRATALNDFERWEVEAVFTMSMSMSEYTPDLRGRLFTWPNFIDPRLHQERFLDRTIDVVLSGSHQSHYPWRRRVARDLARSGIRTMRTPHLGWFNAEIDGHMVEGEAYSRLLNSARIAPACGTIAHELVRKHLEIPANGALLVAEPSAALRAAGFVDMQNCVMVDSEEASDRITHLLSSGDELHRIAAAGHDLVHTRHTEAQRSQIHDWFALRKHTNAASIVQDDPFGPLTTGTASAREPVVLVGRDRILLQRAVDSFCRGEHEVAERDFHRARKLHPNLEAFAGLSLCRLAKGDGRGAADWAAQGLSHCTEVLEGCPDPVLLGLLILAERSCGRPRRARAFAEAYGAVRLPFLDRVRASVGVNGNDAPDEIPPMWGSVVWPWLEPALSLMPLETGSDPAQPLAPAPSRIRQAEHPLRSGNEPALRPVLRRARLRGLSRARRAFASTYRPHLLAATAAALEIDDPEILLVVGNRARAGSSHDVARIAAESTTCPELVHLSRRMHTSHWELGDNAITYTRSRCDDRRPDQLAANTNAVVVVLDPVVALDAGLERWLPTSGSLIVTERGRAANALVRELLAVGLCRDAQASAPRGVAVLTFTGGSATRPALVQEGVTHG